MTARSSSCSAWRAPRRGSPGSTILRKRDGYRRAFEGFDPKRLAAWADPEVERLLADPSIVRNRAKVRSVIGNARALLELTDALRLL